MNERDRRSITFHVNPSEQLLIAGAILVNDVSLASGFPDPSRWPGNSLIAHTRGRQRIALQCVVATAQLPSTGEIIVGHSLLLPAKRESWEGIDGVAHLLNAGVLAELGATAVHPQFQRQGIAKRMREIRQAEAIKRSLALCVSVWDGGPSHPMYQDSEGWTYLGSSLAIYTQRLVHRYIETSALTRQWG